MYNSLDYNMWNFPTFPLATNNNNDNAMLEFKAIRLQ